MWQKEGTRLPQMQILYRLVACNLQMSEPRALQMGRGWELGGNRRAAASPSERGDV